MSIPSVLVAPSYLWNFYLRYLWNYDSNSWVAAIAYAFRIWAIFAIFPTLVLGLLVSNLVPLMVALITPFFLPSAGRDLLRHCTHTR